MILQLRNSKGRITFTAEYWDSTNPSKGVDVKHESGGGYCSKPEDCFLSAACVLIDNPSCVVFGEYKEQFKQFCESKDWFKQEVHLAKE